MWNYSPRGDVTFRRSQRHPSPVSRTQNPVGGYSRAGSSPAPATGESRRRCMLSGCAWGDREGGFRDSRSETNSKPECPNFRNGGPDGTRLSANSSNNCRNCNRAGIPSTPAATTASNGAATKSSSTSHTTRTPTWSTSTAPTTSTRSTSYYDPETERFWLYAFGSWLGVHRAWSSDGIEFSDFEYVWSQPPVGIDDLRGCGVDYGQFRTDPHGHLLDTHRNLVMMMDHRWRSMGTTIACK